MKLSAAENEIACALTKHVQIELTFDRRLQNAPPHVASAVITARLLLVAADAHHGDSASFVEMAKQAIGIIRR